MITKKMILLLITIAAISCSNSSNQTQSSKQQVDNIQSKYPYRAINKNKLMIGDADTLSAMIDNLNFIIYPDGLLSWGDNDTFRLSNDMYVTIAYFYKLDSDIILFCEMSDSDSGTSDIFKINLKTKQLIWKANLNGFNLGLPVIRDKYAYVSAIGSVGKLDLITGIYSYEFSGLYDNVKYSFNQFDTIIFKNNITYFISKQITRKVTDTIIINELNKKITIKK